MTTDNYSRYVVSNPYVADHCFVVFYSTEGSSQAIDKYIISETNKTAVCNIIIKYWKFKIIKINHN